MAATLPNIQPSMSSLANPPMPESNRQIVGYNPDELPEAQQQLGKTGMNIANDIADKQNAVAVEQAKSNLMTTAFKAERQAELEPDPVKAQQVYQQTVTQAVKENTSLIPGISAAAMFQASAGATTAWSNKNLDQIIVNKKKDIGLANINQTTQDMLDAYSQQKDPAARAAIVGQYQKYLGTMRDTGIVNNQQHQTGMQEFAYKASVAYYQLHPEELTTDLQAKLGGNTAAGATVTPKNIGADYVKPYTPQQVQDMRTKLEKPSQYDPLFKKYGEQYGIDPKELKLHALAESDMKPDADNGQSKGMMQLQNDNVTALGVKDPMDPAQSIEGAAKLMAANKKEGAVDPTSADRFYYGGKNGQGKNTEQYAENLGAVRGTMTSTPNNPIGKPIDNIPVYESLAMAKEAETRSNILTSLQTQQQKAAAEKNMDQYLRDGLQGKSTAGVITDPSLNFEQREKVLNALNTVATRGEKTDPAVFNDLIRRTNLPDGDPQKLTNPSDLIPYIGNGITYENQNQIKTLIEGGSDGKDQLKQFFKQGHDQLSSSTAMNIDGEGEQRAYNWYVATNQAIAAGQKKGIPLSKLIDPTAPEYVGDNIEKFRASLADQGANMAKKMRANTPTEGLPAEKQRKSNETAEEYIKRIGL